MADAYPAAPSSRAEELTKTGMDLIRNRRFEDALAVSEQLQVLRYSSAFEIGALALAGLGQLESAVALLQRGVNLAPDVWPNWNLLGNFLSDLGRFEESLQALDAGLQCRDADKDLFNLNRAIVAERTDRLQYALTVLGELRTGAWKNEAAAVEARILLRLGLADQAWEIVESRLSNLAESREPGSGDLLAIGAEVMLATGEPRSEVEASLIQGLMVVDKPERIFDKLREINPITSPNTKHYRLLCDCALMESDDVFMISADVMADNEDEAVAMIKRIADEELEAWTFVVDECEIVEERPSALKGVYRISDRQFYSASGSSL